MPSTEESDGQVTRPPVQDLTQPKRVTDSSSEGHQCQHQLIGSCQLNYCTVSCAKLFSFYISPKRDEPNIQTHTFDVFYVLGL